MIKDLSQVLVIVFLLFSCNGSRDNSVNNIKTESVVPIIDYVYIGSYPHDTTSFTEGFLFHNGKLFESTGATRDLPQTKSLFGAVDLRTGMIDKKVEIDRKKYFGEGITFLKGKVFQLTYKTKVGFIYNATTFKKIGEFTFPSKEGWGLTTDGIDLIMSDGTNLLTYLASNDLHVIKTISVTENGYAKDNLNELEYIKGFIYANIWTTNTIVKIDPKDGKVVGKLDLSSFEYEAKDLYFSSLEMNGIAYDSITDRIYVTGKLWPKIYEIKIDK
jgi:glutaminyl-peptide cyclotransferase